MKPISKSDYVKTIVESLQDLDLKIIFEPGRSIVGDCGILVSQVLYVKEARSKNFLIIDASMSELIRPPLYDAYHKIIPVGEKIILNLKPTMLLGLCVKVQIFLGKDRSLSCKSGDNIVIQDVGAYGSVLSSNYNTRPKPAEYIISNNQVNLIRSSDSIEQILDNEKLLKRIPEPDLMESQEQALSYANA